MDSPCKKTLTVIGMPLVDEGVLSPNAINALAEVDCIVAESKKNAFQFLKQAKLKSKEEIYFLDPPRKDEWELIEEKFAKGFHVGLLSDTGMPILFDPGVEILHLAKKYKYEVHSVPAATSWGTACALSGFSPPFLILGFLNRDASLRKQELIKFKKSAGHLVLMETPYRFLPLLKQIAEVYPMQTPCFLAWELAGPNEFLHWSNLGELENACQKRGLQKGEFVLILHQG